MPQPPDVVPSTRDWSKLFEMAWQVDERRNAQGFAHRRADGQGDAPRATPTGVRRPPSRQARSAAALRSKCRP